MTREKIRGNTCASEAQRSGGGGAGGELVEGGERSPVGWGSVRIPQGRPTTEGHPQTKGESKKKLAEKTGGRKS